MSESQKDRQTEGESGEPDFDLLTVPLGEHGSKRRPEESGDPPAGTRVLKITKIS